jgi:hypothetical protein
MNRLAPLIVRLPERSAPVRALAVPRHWAEFEMALAASPAWLQDAKLFATFWLGGLIFFGTLIA